MKDLFKINLQLFAEEAKDEVEVPEFEEDGVELDDQEDEQEQEEQEEQEEENQEEDQEEDQEEEQEEQEEEHEVPKTVPLAALEAERKKWQERLKEVSAKATIADRLSKATGKNIEALNAELDAMEVQRHVDAGVKPEVANYIVQQQRQMAEISRTLNKQKYDIEVAELKKVPFFGDIDDAREELETYAERTGQSLQQAYMAIRGPQRMLDYEREVEQRVLNNLRKKPKKVDTASNGQVDVKPKLDLSKDEIDMAKAAGMTPQEYAALKKVSSPDQYRKMKKK